MRGGLEAGSQRGHTNVCVILALHAPAARPPLECSEHSENSSASSVAGERRRRSVQVSTTHRFGVMRRTEKRRREVFRKVHCRSYVAQAGCVHIVSVSKIPKCSVDSPLPVRIHALQIPITQPCCHRCVVRHRRGFSSLIPGRRVIRHQDSRWRYVMRGGRDPTARWGAGNVGAGQRGVHITVPSTYTPAL